MRWFRRITLGVFLLVGVIIAYSIYDAVGNDQSQSQRKLILGEIDRAQKIEVIEHSNRWDYRSRDGDVPHEEKIYATVVLSPEQIVGLKSALFSPVPRQGITSHACIFEPHHRIEMTRTDKSMFSMEVCLGCGEFDFGYGPRIMPQGWNESLTSFVASLSMRTNGPWVIDTEAQNK